jgi:hypothetical protein
MTKEPQAAGPEAGERRERLLSLPVLAVVFLLTLASGIVAYLYNMPLGAAELIPLCVIYFVIVIAVRRLWPRNRGR